MKKSILTLAFGIALSGVALAGPVGGWGKAASYDKNPPPPVDLGCDCFGPGISGDLFAGYAWGSGDSPVGNGWGGGAGLNYFLDEYVGFGARYFVFDSDRSNTQHHDISGSLILRYPMPAECIAPYAIVGGGLITNGSTQGTFHVGGGIDLRFADCIGGFADARYTWGGSDHDFASVNAGLRMNF